MLTKSVLFFHPSSDLYGADKILIYVMKNFPSYDKYLVLPSDGPLCELIKEQLPNIKIKIIPQLPIIAKKNMTLSGFIYFIYSILNFPFKLKAHNIKPDIVYINTLAVSPILIYYPFSTVKKIAHIHEILKNNRFIHKLINKFVLKNADILICVSNAVKNNLKIASSRYKHKLHLVQNGINFKEKKSMIEISEIKSDKINFALIGRIKPDNKGQILLLQAISKLNKNILEKTHFYFVGSPVVGQEYMLSDVESLILELKLSNNVTIIPFIKNIEAIYQKIDVVVVPSIFDDPFPTTVLEGMFFSKPVIGTKVGGIPEMIEDNITGYIIPREDAIELSNKITELALSPSKIRMMGENGKVRFTENFSESSFHDRFQHVLKNICIDK